ncbi:uncharacterized protein [Antedon mediterranea]|uniref:uncharacterized protein isoform X2 n=1 Tax=Antedon mediterranea TaxID=105859 RepID=UPI003AF969D8
MDAVNLMCVFVLIGCMYGASASPTPASKPFQKEQKTFEVDGGELVETIEDTDDGQIIDVEAQRGNGALTVFTDVTHGLLVHRYGDDDQCYISSLAEYNATRLEHGSPSELFKYRLESVSEINKQYFSHTATDQMKRVCNGVKNILWSEVHAEFEEQETREKRDCYVRCGYYCSYYGCSYVCRLTCYW